MTGQIQANRRMYIAIVNNIQRGPNSVSRLEFCLVWELELLARVSAITVGDRSPSSLQILTNKHATF